MGKQKTAIRAGALIDNAKKWKSVDWKNARCQVRRLQVRIAKAVKENRWNKAKAVHYLLTRSFCAKLLAVKRVTPNKGKRPLALTTFCGKAREPNGGLFTALADVVINLNHSEGFISPRRTGRNVHYQSRRCINGRCRHCINYLTNAKT